MTPHTRSTQSIGSVGTIVALACLLATATNLGFGQSAASAATASTLSGQPVGVRLAGLVTRGGQMWSFEIVMEGFDHYFCKEWEGAAVNVPGSSGSWMASLVLGTLDGRTGESWSEYGTRGGGGGILGENGAGVARVGRRLWNGDQFRAVVADELREAVEYGHYVEEFSAPVSANHFATPCTIQWTDSSRPAADQTTTYIIDTVEFRYQHAPQFFTDTRNKYFPKSFSPAPPPEGTLNPAQAVAKAAIERARLNPDQGADMARAALKDFPLSKALGVRDQSELLGALWRIRGIAEKETLVDWFYQTLPTARINSKNGELDHGPLCLLREIEAARRTDTADLMLALMADQRFSSTDVPTTKEMLILSHEGFALPKDLKWKMDLKVAVLKPLLPAWRDELRRHYSAPLKG